MNANSYIKLEFDNKIKTMRRPKAIKLDDVLKLVNGWLQLRPDQFFQIFYKDTENESVRIKDQLDLDIAMEVTESQKPLRLKLIMFHDQKELWSKRMSGFFARAWAKRFDKYLPPGTPTWQDIDQSAQSSDHSSFIFVGGLRKNETNINSYIKLEFEDEIIAIRRPQSIDLADVQRVIQEWLELHPELFRIFYKDYECDMVAIKDQLDLDIAMEVTESQKPLRLVIKLLWCFFHVYFFKDLYPTAKGYWAHVSPKTWIEADRAAVEEAEMNLKAAQERARQGIDRLALTSDDGN